MFVNWNIFSRTFARLHPPQLCQWRYQSHPPSMTMVSQVNRRLDRRVTLLRWFRTILTSLQWIVHRPALRGMVPLLYGPLERSGLLAKKKGMSRQNPRKGMLQEAVSAVVDL